MKESDRLTTATYKHMTDKYKTATKKWEVSFQKVYDQLFAYEETGLSPEEVKRLKYNTECVIKKLEELKNGGVCTYRNDLASDALTLIEKLKAENAALKKEKTLADEAIGNLFHNVAKLDRENAELREKVEGTPNLEFQIGDIAYYIGFAFSDGYDEQDEMTHDVKFYVYQKRLDTESERMHACGDYLEQKAFKSKKAAKEFAAARLKELEANE